MGILYLVGLVVALVCMVVLDRRFHLFFWRGWLRATIVLVVGLAFFLAWDVSGIGLGIFFRGETSFMTGIEVGRELPLEEPFFLALLCYLTMNLLAWLPLLVAQVATRRVAKTQAATGQAPNRRRPQ